MPIGTSGPSSKGKKRSTFFNFVGWKVKVQCQMRPKIDLRPGGGVILDLLGLNRLSSYR